MSKISKDKIYILKVQRGFCSNNTYIRRHSEQIKCDKMFPRKLVNAEVSLNDKYNIGREYVISDSGYGKDHVKILHVQREGNVHHVKEFEVNTHLKLFSKKDYLEGKLTFTQM